MKSFQQIAPTISAWLASFTKRFRQMPRGWFRLLIVVYGVALVAIFATAANSAPVYQETLENVAGAVLWLYWPMVRLWLWVYDGFQKKKTASPIKLDSGGDNRNN